MKSRIKVPAANEGGRIKPHISVVVNADSMRPIFCFEHMVGGFCVGDCTKDEKAHLIDAIFKRTKLTWAELKQAPKHGLGYEKISTDSLNEPVPKGVKEDAQMIAFRFSGKAPMVGFRDREIFRVIWLDRVFTLYKH